MAGHSARPNTTPERLELAMEGDVDGVRVPLTFRDRAEFEEFQRDLRDALKRGGVHDAVVQQVGSATTGFKGNPTKPFGPWRPDSDTDLAVFSQDARKQAMANNSPVNPKIVQNGNYTVFKNEIKGTDQGFYKTPVGRELEALAVKWNIRVYGDASADGFDFKLNTTTKPFGKAITVASPNGSGHG